MNHSAGPYANAAVTKKECVSHIAKRLGTRLRLLNKTAAEDITTSTVTRRMKTVYGGKNMLTDTVIDKLTSYFGEAIRDCTMTSVESMRKQALLGYYHASSTGADPKHMDCLKGPVSYCFYNKDLAENRTPSTHTDMKVRFQLEPHLKKAFLAIYLDLPRTDLLRRYLKDKTQNPNESFYSKIWNKLSKTKFVSLPTARCSIADSVLQHNNGSERGINLSEYITSIIQYLQHSDKNRKSNVSNSTPKQKKGNVMTKGVQTTLQDPSEINVNCNCVFLAFLF